VSEWGRCGGACRYGELAFNLDYYMDVQDLSYLVQHMERSNPRMSKRYSKLTAGLCELVEDFALVSFAGVSISDRERCGGCAACGCEGKLTQWG
jgi:MinD superfamily P-loop ATPase